jgi:hypothetical protein
MLDRVKYLFTALVPETNTPLHAASTTSHLCSATSLSYSAMPPRGNEGLDFTPILTHYLFLSTAVLSIVRSPIAIVIFAHSLFYRWHGS